eukprot:CAMPEP_0174994586 /NCGR_PEP_ID=MMETSP0004_2-20121128/23709_1 /TAXON_ID=420556 /ORGANISM="Ochromonas sp., Strain CCMP1393" /LENGTH=223 /DNA_ID=CAMNT_0016248821 /DNA_START=12 /DNA_END=679 /DNA_ORIENTATION=-
MARLKAQGVSAESMSMFSAAGEEENARRSTGRAPRHLQSLGVAKQHARAASASTGSGSGGGTGAALPPAPPSREEVISRMGPSMTPTVPPPPGSSFSPPPTPLVANAVANPMAHPLHHTLGHTHHAPPPSQAIAPGIRMLVDRIKKEMVARGARGFIGLQRKFRIMDDDGSKTLCLSEFKKGMKEMNLGLSDSEIRMLFEHFDADGNGTIDFEEFIQGVRDPL